jgi:S-DNA-T family DNA segregation ATPase FtsK/SpoIIIE
MRVGPELALYVPNKEKQFVDFKDYLHWYIHSIEETKAIIPIPLGISPQGHKETLDLTKCPHILIAGQTGSGKSIFESAIITCLAARFTSSELKLCLVDTKQVDLPLFAKLPHILQCAKSRSEYMKLMDMLYKSCKTRLNVFNSVEVRNVEEYKNKTGNEMSYIILVIDEFANLIDEDNAARSQMDLQERKEVPTVSDRLKTLAQISRAAGIHIIAGTQRSSVKIISGDIKVNFPCRIALKLPSTIDSRTILDESGAESELGCGDMLVKIPDSDLLKRFHGPFVKLSDIDYIVNNLETVKEFL